MTPRVLIVRAPGTNCDEETAYAFQLAGASTDTVHINRWLEQPGLASEYQVLCFPGGFSYGDDVAAGRILGNQLQQFLADEVRAFRDQDKLVLGICNGFQVLLKAGLLASEGSATPLATLGWNAHGRFEDRWVHLAAEAGNCPFLAGVERLYLPIAHAEGNFMFRDQQARDQLASQGQLVLRYGGSDGAANGFPDNPNGSDADVAGICDRGGRVFGLMPHPERFVDKTHHPRWTRETLDAPDGLAIFRNAVGYFR